MIGLPPVLNYCNDTALRDRVAHECFSGKKAICLAISEAFAGSDVAGIRTTAVKSPCGKFYIVNGTKKWITNGMWSDYFTTAVRTEKGFSVLLIERGEGVETEVCQLIDQKKNTVRRPLLTILTANQNFLLFCCRHRVRHF